MWIGLAPERQSTEYWVQLFDILPEESWNCFHCSCGPILPSFTRASRQTFVKSFWEACTKHASVYFKKMQNIMKLIRQSLALVFIEVWWAFEASQHMLKTWGFSDASSTGVNHHFPILLNHHEILGVSTISRTAACFSPSQAAMKTLGFARRWIKHGRTHGILGGAVGVPAIYIYI